MKVIDIEKIVADYGNSVFHDDLKRVDSASALEISAIARKLGLADDYVFDDTGYHLDVSSLVESLTEDKSDFKDLTIEEMFFEVAGKKFKVFDKNGHFTKEAWKLYDKVAERFGDYDKFDALCGEEGCFEDDEDIQYSANESLKESKEPKLETFEDKMNFLAKDEQEAIDGYDKVIALLDAEKDAVVIEQLNKIKIEEEAHKKYLEDVKENHDLVYTEPLEQEEVKEGAEGHKVPGKEYVIYDCSLENEKKAPIVAIRSTYTEAQWYCNKPGNFDKDLGIEEVPVGKFKKGDDFYGPFDGDWNLVEASSAEKKAYKDGGQRFADYIQGKAIARIKDPEARDAAVALAKAGNSKVDRFVGDRKVDQAERSFEKKADKMQKAGVEEAKEGKHVEYIEMPHEVYDTPEEIKRINDELDAKAKAGKLIGIRKEPKMLQLAEPEINGIWTIYLNDKGFIEKIVVF